MRVVEVIFGVGWAAFWIYWIIAAFSSKRGRIPVRREVGIRLVIALIVLLALRAGALRGGSLNESPLRAGIGLLLFALGLAFAIWARVHLGRNWGTPMSRKADPELVTTGPYRRVRHPIYTGILLGLVGNAVGLSWYWLLAAGLAGVYFFYSATVEERTMTEQFPDAYPAYVSRTKMLVPFLF
jgi:protein-S-isoprenylcysteine O-methyltransferase Ste14